MAYRGKRRPRNNQKKDTDRIVLPKKDSALALSFITHYKKVYAAIPSSKKQLGGAKFLTGEKLSKQLDELEHRLLKGSFTQAELGDMHKTISNYRICAMLSDDTISFFGSVIP